MRINKSRMKESKAQLYQFAKLANACHKTQEDFSEIRMRFAIFSIFLTLSPLSASAQAVLDCFGYRASALAIPEPWEAHSKTYSNGKVRVTLTDTLEPAAGALYLLIQSPPYDEMFNRTCAVIGSSASGIGFGGLDWEALDASYDPSTGLTVRVGVSVHSGATGGFDPAILAVTINQATGAIVPRYEIP